MNKIKSFLAKCKNIKCVVLLAGSENISELETYLKQELKIKKVVITDNPNKTAEEIHTEIDLLLFDQTATRSDLERASVLKPRYLAGIAESAKIDIAAVWKQYRSIAQKIYICIKKQGEKQEILQWRRNKSNIDLSIIVPIYNTGKNLSQCIASMLAWKVPYVEYLIVTSNAEQLEPLLKKYQEKDIRIRILQKENSNNAALKNKGLEEARGTYISFIHPNDFVAETMYEKLLMRAICGGYDYVYCEAQNSKSMSNGVLQSSSIKGTINIDKIYDNIVKSKLELGQGIYKKDMLSKNKICFNEQIEWHEDLPFKLEALFAAQSIAYVPEQLYFCRNKPETSFTDDRLFVYFCIFDYLDRKILATQDQRKIDCLQLVKIDTHKSASKQIAGKWRKEYIKRAEDDIYRNMGWGRNIFLFIKSRIHVQNLVNIKPIKI